MGFKNVLTGKAEIRDFGSPRRSSVPTQVRTEDLLQELVKILASLRVIVEGLPAVVPSEMQVWSVYAGTEKTVAILKFRLGAERPGIFSVPPLYENQAELLTTSLEKMTDASLKMKANQLLAGLEALRCARDNLRAYLSEERKTRMRAKRRALSTGTSS